VAVEDAALARLRGNYVLPDGGRLGVAVARGGLNVAADGQSAVDLVAGADMAARAQRMEASARSDTLVRAWRSGDWGPMHRAFGAAVPLAEFARRQAGMRARYDSALGPVTGHAVLGTRRQGPALLTRVRVDHARGSVYENYGWAGGSIVLFSLQDDAPADRFLPESPTSFVNVDVRSGSVVRLEARADGSLVVHGPGGDVVARREGGA
jgi:hypothetical protein